MDKKFSTGPIKSKLKDLAKAFNNYYSARNSHKQNKYFVSFKNNYYDPYAVLLYIEKYNKWNIFEGINSKFVEDIRNEVNLLEDKVSFQLTIVFASEFLKKPSL